MTGTGRIRWESNDQAVWSGYVGTMKPWAFRVWQRNYGHRQWMLMCQLPGLPEDKTAVGPETLKADAERWLEEFATSLGAVFEPESDESVAFQLSEARDVLARWDAERADPDGKIFDRQRVLADQLRAVLAIADNGAGQ